MTPIQPCLRESKLSFSLFPFFSPIMVSSVWDHFTKDSYSDKATCNLCPATYCVKKGSTSNLWRHLEQKHPYCLTTSQVESDKLYRRFSRHLTAGNEYWILEHLQFFRERRVNGQILVHARMRCSENRVTCRTAQHHGFECTREIKEERSDVKESN
ncbi:hypothetical protein PMAYCL1PPCAC_33109 [Pristionchus mayeri]|uniref:BED-type domain-containing protein n=1 Tax=Pristionchus mayeri TaxID=1317129 RepID=A0AAN5DGR5_9BILA|nr:hypothetical protein PMAYCL1PPCAC_33109 [Pristionchus mayeri]